MKKWAIVKDNVVIDNCLWDGECEWQYPFPHDEIIELTEALRIGIGWWRDENGNWNEPGESYQTSDYDENNPPTED
jgi:hypothetical protein